MNSFDGLWGHMAAGEAMNDNVRDFIIDTAESMIAMGHNERGGVLSTARRTTRFEQAKLWVGGTEDFHA